MQTTPTTAAQLHGVKSTTFDVEHDFTGTYDHMDIDTAPEVQEGVITNLKNQMPLQK